VGVDDEVGDRGSVVFEVWDGTTELLFSSGRRAGADVALPVTVSLEGVSVLRLVVTDAGDGFFYDHADWADANLSCVI
jgi:NPCBM/NEW2 domain